jgi:outer membrane protein TolC
MIRTRLAILLAGVTLAGCSGHPSRWFEPEWDRLILEEAQRDEQPDAPPPTATADPLASLPDLDADGPIELSVEQATLLALARNRDLRVAELNPVITGEFERIERGVFDPEVFAGAEVAREEALEIDRGTGQQFSVTGDDSALEAGVRQSLPTGTDVELNVTQDRSASDRAPEQQQARLGLTVTQALLRGFGPAVNLAAVRQAELDTLASRYELRGFIESLLADTEVAYWEYLLAERTIDIFERSLEVAREQSDQVQQRIEVGVLARTEAAAARTEVAVREQALVEARADLRAARLRLLRLLGASALSAERTIVATTRPPEAGEEVGAVADRVAIARRLRPDLNEARLRLEQGRLETIRTRNGVLPRLDLFVALGKTGYADTFTDSFRELDGETYDYTVGLSFSQFIGRNSAEGAFQAALATREQAAASVANLEQVVELDVALAASEVQRSREQIDATVTTRELQEQTVQAEIERFEVGASTTLLVAQAQRDLLQAQINEVEAVANHRIALIRLYLAEGSLLERRGVTLD